MFKHGMKIIARAIYPLETVVINCNCTLENGSGSGSWFTKLEINIDFITVYSRYLTFAEFPF